MRITFVLPSVAMAGGNKVVVIYAQKLTQRGHIVKLVSPPPRLIPSRAKIASFLKGRGWPLDTKRHPSPLDDSGLDHTILDRWRPVTDDDVPDADVVVATWWETAEWVAALRPRKGAKVYFIQHHEVFPYLPIARCRATYRLPLHKIVVAKWLKDLMASEYGDTVVDLVPNSVDRDQFFAPVRGKRAVPTVGFLYSRTPFKGLDLLLKALVTVREHVPQLHMVSFGSETPRAPLALPEGTEFFCYPPQHQIRELYARCDVWVTASKSEGFNLPAMEAMACRTPVVSTRTGWPEEAIKPGWNGELVDIDDTEGLARGIARVLTLSDEAWRTQSSNACATVADSSWDTTATMFEKALFNAQHRK